MKKFLLSVATVAMFANFANAEVITLSVNDSTDIKGTEVAEVAAGVDDKRPNGEARHFQPLNSFVLGDFDFQFGNNGRTTEPALYFPMSTKEGNNTVRIYAKNTMTISAPSDMPIGSVVAYDVKNRKNVTIYAGEPKTEITFTASAPVRFESFTITVGEAGETPKAEKGEAAENPFTVAEALKYIEDGGSEKDIKYVIGYVTAIKEVSTSYGNAEFTLCGSMTDTEGLTVFRCTYLKGEKFTSEDQLQVGMHVIVNGKLMLYQAKNSKQLAYGELVSIDASGVEGIVADADEAPVYYNMQGVRVANPENGVFIEVKGNKATKVVL